MLKNVDKKKLYAAVGFAAGVYFGRNFDPHVKIVVNRKGAK